MGPITILGCKWAFLSLTYQIFKLWYYQNYCIEPSQILHNDRPPNTFVGGPNMPKKSKMADGWHLETLKTAVSPQWIDHFDEISRGDVSRLSGPRQSIKFRISKFKMAAAPSWN